MAAVTQRLISSRVIGENSCGFDGVGVLRIGSVGAERRSLRGDAEEQCRDCDYNGYYDSVSGARSGASGIRVRAYFDNGGGNIDSI